MRDIGETRTDIINKDLEQGSTATPFSTFFWAAFKDDWATAEAQYADDIEWDMMSNNQIRKGKKEVVPWLKAAKYGSQKEPTLILNRADKEWGIWEYWNIGADQPGVIEFAKQPKWPFPADVSKIIGQKYKVPVCFIYHINAMGGLAMPSVLLIIPSNYLNRSLSREKARIRISVHEMIPR
jgi:hypothetical protein